jgi:hypothetical protein
VKCIFAAFFAVACSLAALAEQKLVCRDATMTEFTYEESKDGTKSSILKYGQILTINGLLKRGLDLKMFSNSNYDLLFDEILAFKETQHTSHNNGESVSFRKMTYFATMNIRRFDEDPIAEKGPHGDGLMQTISTPVACERIIFK